VVLFSIAWSVDFALQAVNMRNNMFNLIFIKSPITNRGWCCAGIL
jgi:hypothetical protein